MKFEMRNDMAQIKVFYEPEMELLTVFWQSPRKEQISTELGDRVILIKDATTGEPIGLEILLQNTYLNLVKPCLEISSCFIQGSRLLLVHRRKFRLSQAYFIYGGIFKIYCGIFVAVLNMSTLRILASKHTLTEFH